MESLYLKYTHRDQQFKVGCIKVADNIWRNKGDSINSQINGVYEGPDVTAEYCRMRGKATGLSIKVVINIKKSIPGVFTNCSSYEKDVGEVASEQLRFVVL